MENKKLAKAGLAVVALLVAGFIGYQFGRGEVEPEIAVPQILSGERKSAQGHSSMTMDEMTAGLDGLQGDAFDKAFVEMMIAHHQGAVDMAALIPVNAKHEELKRLGQDIIATQTKEIVMMEQWLKDWGYLGTGQKIDDAMIPGMQH